MSTSTRVVVTPDDLQTLADRFSRVGDDCARGCRRVEAATGAVVFNRLDSGFGIVSFEIRRVAAEFRLRRAADDWRVDAGLIGRTLDEALAADAIAGAEVIDELSSRIVGWSGTDNDPLLDGMTRDRERLLLNLAGGSAPAAAVLGAHVRRGGSLARLFAVAASDDDGVRATVQELVSEGHWGRARDLDQALAVAQLVTGGGLRDRARSRRSDPIAQFDRLAVTGADLTVAANAAVLGIELPTSTQLSALTAKLTAAFGPGGTAPELTTAEWAWLPFAIRMPLQIAPASAEHGSDGLRSSVAGEQFRGGPDAVSTEVLVIGELGRAGLDHGAGSLAHRLVTLATSPEGGADLRLHGHIADVLADASTNLDAAFFARLGSEGTGALPGVVMAGFHPVATPSLSSTSARLGLLGVYGDAMAHVERRRELTFSADDLLAPGDLLHSPAHLFVGAEPFSKSFSLQAAQTLLTDHTPNLFGVVDPRAAAIGKLAMHSPSTAVELFDLLGHNFLDALLWPEVPLQHGAEVDPVYRLLAPVLDSPSVRPELAAEVVNAAVLRGPTKLAFDSAETIQHAILADMMLLAPTEGHRLGGARVELDKEVRPVDVVSLMEQVLNAGSGGGLIAYSNTVVSTTAQASASSVQGLDHLSEDQQVVTSEILGGISAAYLEARASVAQDIDSRNANIKLWGPAVFTGVSGALVPAGPAISGVVGVTGGVLGGAGTNIALPTDNFERLGWIVANEQGATSSNIVELMRQALVESGSISQSDLDAAKAGVINFEDITVVLAGGQKDEPLRNWQDRFGSYERLMGDYEEAYLATKLAD